MPRVKIEEKRVDYEVVGGNVNLYLRADSDVGRDMLEKIAQVPLGMSRMGATNTDVRDALYNYFKDKGCLRVRVALAELVHLREHAFYHIFDYGDKSDKRGG